MDPKHLMQSSQRKAKLAANKSAHLAKKAAVKSGAAGPLYRAANRAVVVGDKTVTRARRVGTRKLAERGYELTLDGRPQLRRQTEAELHPDTLPDTLSRLAPDVAEGLLILPSRIAWSDPHRVYDLSNLDDREAAYALLLRAGTRADIEANIDGPRLAAMWDTLRLPDKVRERFAPLVARV